MNSLGIELLRTVASADQNAVLWPYSIDSALAMAYAGADGLTREEMANVLHFPTNRQDHRHSLGVTLKTARAIDEHSVAPLGFVHMTVSSPLRRSFLRWLLLAFALFTITTTRAAALASHAEMMAAGKDLWGEAAMNQTNGASYEFFENILPPLRYVNADFHYYPIVLCAPRNPLKARLISNGSGINLRGGARHWSDPALPVTFRVGPDEFRFGENPQRLQQPTLADGYLPIVRIDYFHHRETYAEETFASVDPKLAPDAVLLVKFSLAKGDSGLVSVQIDSTSTLTFTNGVVRCDDGIAAWCEGKWKWENNRLHAALQPGKSVTLAIATRPVNTNVASPLANDGYEHQRQLCAQTWNDILKRGVNIETPERVVNNAWRNLVIQNFTLIKGDRMHYSAGNQYDQLYEHEGSDAALGLMMYGQEAEMRRLIVPLLDFTRKNLEFHQAGHKLDDVCRYYWQTRDAAFVRSIRPRWEKELQRIVTGRTNEYGLFRREQYCGDIATPVYSLNSNTKCWLAAHDLAAVLADMGEKAEAEQVGRMAAEFRAKILNAIDHNVQRRTTPPFVPIAMFPAEEIHDPITATRIGSYWNLVINSVIKSGIFAPGSEQEKWIPGYLENHGGLCMGMIRGAADSVTFWTGRYRVNPLYGIPYVVNTLQRDDPERALVSFYGMLAQGMTRNTFMAGESSSLTPLDEGGRLVFLPPNSAGNAHVLWMLRHLLVQDFDLNDDGEPETLRLAFGTPRRWLEDGKVIRVERMPTAFGPVSLQMESHLAEGKIIATVDLPTRNHPAKIFLRARVPQGWTVTAAQVGAEMLKADANGSVDISNLQGKQGIRFVVRRQA